MIMCMGAGDITKWAAGLADGIAASEGVRNERRRDTLPKVTRQADRRRAAGAAGVVQERRQGAMAVRAGRRRRSRRVPARARSRRAGDGARPRLQHDRPRRRRARRGRAARQGVRQDRAARTTRCCECGGGASGILVSSTARDAGIAGLEFLRGIPGTVGGFVRMNGGAYGREVQDILVSATLVLRSGAVEEWPLSGSATATATASCPDGAVVVGATFRGTPGDPASDRRRDGPHRRRARGNAAAPQPHRRVDLQEPAGPQGVGADRRRGLPRDDSRRRASFGKALQFPAQSR